MTIYKYPLVIADRQLVSMPVKSMVRAVMMQRGVLCLWAEVDPLSTVVSHAFYIVGTGHQLPDVPYLYYLGSVIDGSLVWHVYQELRAELAKTVTP